MDSRHRRSEVSLDPDTGDSLVSEAAPVAGRPGDGPDSENRASASSKSIPRKTTLVGMAGTIGVSLGGIFGKRKPAQSDPEYGEDVPVTRGASYAEDDSESMSEQSPETVKCPLQAFKGSKPGDVNLAQQSHPAGSVNCPVQRLQNQLRLHNSSDPRPKIPAPITVADRDSVSTISSCSTASRFSFGLDVFRFRDFRTSGGGRGSGWSSWFKQDDSGKSRPSDLASDEKQQSERQ